MGAEGAGKTAALRDLAEWTGAPLINVGVDLSRCLLDLTGWQRPIRVAPLLEQVAAETEGDVVLLDNIELLFDAALHQDPIRLLRGLSRSRTVVAAWKRNRRRKVTSSMPHPGIPSTGAARWTEFW